MLKTANDLFDRIVNCQPFFGSASTLASAPRATLYPENPSPLRFKSDFRRALLRCVVGDSQMANRTIQPTGYSGLVAGAILSFVVVLMACRGALGPLTDLPRRGRIFLQHLGADVLLDNHMGSQELRPVPDHTNFPARAWSIDHCVRKRCVLSSGALLWSGVKTRLSLGCTRLQVG